MLEFEKPWLDRPIIRFSLSFAVVIAAFLLRQLLVLHLGVELPVFILFFPVVMVAALFFGFWPGILATALSAVLVEYWFFPPVGQFKVENGSNLFALFLFSAMGVFMSVIAERYRRYQRRVALFEKELALRDTAELLQKVSESQRLAVEAADLGTWDYRFKSGEVVWDELCRNRFGFAAGEQAEYAAAIERIHPEDRLTVDEAIKEAIAGANDGVYNQEFRVVWPDGSIHWLASHGRAYFEGEAGTRWATRFIGVNSEITTRKLSEEALQASEQRYRNLFDNMTEGFCIIEVLFDSDGKPEDYRFLEVNSAFEGQTGLHDAAGKCIRALRPAHEAHWFEIFGKIALTGEPAHFINQAKALDRWYDVHAYRVADPELRRVAIVFNEISDLKRAETALEENAERLRLALDAGSTATWDMDLPNGGLTWNDEMFRQLGYEPGSIMPSYGAWQRRLFPDDMEKAEAAFKESLDHGYDLLSEFRVLGMNDEVRWLEARGRSERDKDGNAVRSFGVVMDITGRKLAEEHLQQLNRTLRALSNSTQALLRATDEQRFLNEVCRIITEDCGHRMVWIGIAEDDEDKTVRPLAIAGHEDGYLQTVRISWGDNERGRGPTGVAIRSGQPALCNNMLTDPAFLPWREAALRHGYASSLVIPLKEGEKAWGAMGIYAARPDAFSEGEINLLTELAGDLTFGMQTLRTRAAHAFAEELARSLLTTIQAEKERLTALVNSIKDEVWFADTEKRFTLANPAAHKEFDLPDSYGNVDIAIFASTLEVLRRDGTPRPVEDAPPLRALRGEVVKDELEIVRTRVNGELRYREVSSAPVNDAMGMIVGAVSVVRDVTERIKAEQALLRSEKLASVGRMAAVIAHEINNPLAAVTNLLYLAQGITDLPETARQYVEMADAELRRIAHITQQSLGFYRESNAPAIVPVNSLLDSALDLMQSRIKARRAVIERQMIGTLDVSAIAGELRQVFSNLLANSLDAIDEGGRIRLRAKACYDFKNSRRCVRVTIADNGRGINPASRQHIFEPFFTTKGTVGTGLGLWVAKQIVDKHSGTIHMHSFINGERRGTVFSVVLPVEPVKNPLLKSI